MSNPVLHEFRYRLKPGGMMPLVVIVGLGIAVCLYFAVFPPLEPVRINEIELSGTEFRLAMGALAAVATLFLALIAKATFSDESECGRIALTADVVLLPGPDEWGNAAAANEEMELRYAEIASADIVPFVAHEVKLHIVFSGGQIGLPRNMFESRQEFKRFSQCLGALIDSKRSAGFAAQKSRLTPATSRN
jgi:hypothetical protein